MVNLSIRIILNILHIEKFGKLRTILVKYGTVLEKAGLLLESEFYRFRTSNIVMVIQNKPSFYSENILFTILFIIND